MQRKFAQPLVLSISISLLAVPFIYNSCQGVLGAKGFSAASTKTASCKVMMENGHVIKLKTVSAPSSFAAQKVKLLGAGVQATMLQKGSDVSLNAGSELSVIVNPSCVLATSSHSAILNEILQDSEMNSNFESEAFSWELNRSYLGSELEQMAQQDPCIIGVSWNQQYKMEAFSDPGSFYQNNLPAIHAEQAFAEFFNPNYGMHSSGAYIRVAVLDTGIDWTHPDLAANIWTNADGWGVDATTLKTSAVSYNPIDVSSIGHGTHVSGIIAAVTDNGIGIVGLMPRRAQIMAIKVFKSTNGTLSTNSTYIYNGIQYAYQNGASVINMSLAAAAPGANSDAVVEAGFDEALAHGVVLVVVIGNSDATNAAQEVNGTTFSSLPGQFAVKEGVLGVGSFDTSTGSKSSFSHYSKIYAEIGAPGAENGTTGIYSTLPVTLSSYGRLAGTSQAGPHVSAAAALTIGLIKEAYGVAPTPREVERLILASAIRSPALYNYFKNGNRLDLQTLVEKIQLDYPKTKVTGTGPAPLPASCVN